MTSLSRPFVDALSRFVFEEAAVHGGLVSVDATCREILGCHRYPPALARVLAELLAAAALLASTLKFDGRLIVQLRGEGPLRLLVVECDATLALRATAQWSTAVDAMPADADLAALAGGASRARLAIILDPREGGPLYQGIVALEAASVATLIEHYLATSEQIASRLVLAVDAERARGLLLQRLPDTGADDRDWDRVLAEAASIGTRELLAATNPATLLGTRFPDRDIRLFDARPTRFACACSEARIGNALAVMGPAEVEGLIAERGVIEVTCEFCNRRYTFDAAAARALLARHTPRAAGAAKRDGDA